MEIVIGIIIVVVILFVLGGMDNNRPVKDWSDDKLNRMHPKLMNARQYEKADEVKKEIERRQQERKAEEILNQLPQQGSSEMDMLHKMAANMAKLTQTVMAENSCSEEEANAIISKRIETIEANLKAQGLSEDEVSERALKELGLI
ncbi:hypothetical protein [Arsukibacterium perlucidum]|uniref:hypothetical protein n=1 Tax=Arsukibacterium perlucidum TaxID=368811 RepID=UPI0003650C2A|nr:hypothetical protein [Arsukibacterium perlucidum]